MCLSQFNVERHIVCLCKRYYYVVQRVSGCMLFIRILVIGIFDASHARLRTTELKSNVGLYLNDESVYYE